MQEKPIEDLLSKIVNFIILGLLGWIGLTLFQVHSNQIRITTELSYLQASIEKIEKTGYTKSDARTINDRIFRVEETLRSLAKRVERLEDKIDGR